MSLESATCGQVSGLCCLIVYVLFLSSFHCVKRQRWMERSGMGYIFLLSLTCLASLLCLLASWFTRLLVCATAQLHNRIAFISTSMLYLVL